MKTSTRDLPGDAAVERRDLAMCMAPARVVEEAEVVRFWLGG